MFSFLPGKQIQASFSFPTREIRPRQASFSYLLYRDKSKEPIYEKRACTAAQFQEIRYPAQQLGTIIRYSDSGPQTSRLGRLLGKITSGKSALQIRDTSMERSLSEDSPSEISPASCLFSFIFLVWVE